MTAVRLGYDTIPPPDSMQDRFNDGHLHEPDILRRMEETYGLSPVHQQLEVTLPIRPGLAVRGHIDCLVNHPTYGWCVADAKALAESGWTTWKSTHFDTFPYYAWQMSVYAYALAEEFGEPKGRPLPILMAVKNKNASKMVIDEGDYFLEPPRTLTEIKARVELMHGFTSLPPCDRKQWPCSTNYLCDEVAHVGVTDSPAIDQAAKEYVRAVNAEKAAKGDKSQARERIVSLLRTAGETSVNTGAVIVKLSTKTRKSVDKAKFAAAHPGIALEDFEVETEYEQLDVKAAKG